MYNPKIKLISFKSSEHINETGDGPYRGFGSNSQLYMYICTLCYHKTGSSCCLHLLILNVIKYLYISSVTL